MKSTVEGHVQILLVEDDDDAAVLLTRALSRLDARYAVVKDGDEVVEYLTATGRHSGRVDGGWPDLILLDLGLPGRSGLNVMRWIRWEAGVTATPIVVLTASATPESIRQAYRLGANSYLLKPKRADDLRALAESVVGYWLGLNVLDGGSHA